MAGKQDAQIGALIEALDGEALLADLEALWQMGLEPGRPEPGGGARRLAYGPADVQARRWLMERMRECGMSAGMDVAGNVIGVYPGTGGLPEALPPLALGSHTDSVPDGGKYDGALGVLGALACVRTLHASGARLRRPLHVIDFAGEEATTSASPLGSLAYIGGLTGDMLELPAWTGERTRDYLVRCGFDPAWISAQRPQQAPAAYLELHIEQGERLDATGVSIGVVEGIVSIRSYQVTLRGRANHAGTTGMARRKDALVAAAPLILAVRETALKYNIVGTVGRVVVEPNAPNVIPGLVQMDVELRSLDDTLLDRAERELRALAVATGATFLPGMMRPAVKAHPAILTAIETACEWVGVSHARMPSGAVHDATNMAQLCPIGMIFVPSVDGISHAPDEYTRAEDCVNGARVLLATVMELDTRLM